MSAWDSTRGAGTDGKGTDRDTWSGRRTRKEPPASGPQHGVFIERLGLVELLWMIWVGWIRRQLGGIPRGVFAVDELTRWARALAGLLRTCGLGIAVHELDFDYVDEVRTPDGSPAREVVVFRAAPPVIRAIESHPCYNQTIRDRAGTAAHESYLHAYCSKQLYLELCAERGSLLRSILVVEWFRRTRLGDGRDPVRLYVRDHWSLELLADDARGHAVELCRLPGWLFIGERLRDGLRTAVRAVFQRVRRLWPGSLHLPGKPPLRVAVEIYWRGIGRDRRYDTELFWYRHGTLPYGAVFAYFVHYRLQPTASRRATLREAEMGWADREACRQLKLRQVRGTDGAGPVAPRPRQKTAGRDASGVWDKVHASVDAFYTEYARWYRFCNASGTRIHVSTYDVFPSHEALHAALADVGGVAVSLQRSIEREPYLFRRTVTDVHFAFSRAQAERERRSGSSVRQFITAGYPFDDAFSVARVSGRQRAAALRAQGAEFVICFFDQSHGLRPKWLGGRRQTQGDYAFLCDRLERDQTLGLILKPKNPETLPGRLGPVWPRVRRLIDAGRCLFLDYPSMDQRDLPCVAAGAADLAIHMAVGATAGLESYLCGTRTLLMRHGMDPGAFAKLPPGTVLFESWPELWAAVERIRANPTDPQIGNWEPIIEEFASLRDGYASTRVNQYVTWLYEALAAGGSREQAMADAGRRYAAQWGEDLVVEIVPPPLGTAWGCAMGPDHGAESAGALVGTGASMPDGSPGAAR